MLKVEIPDVFAGGADKVEPQRNAFDRWIVVDLLPVPRGDIRFWVPAVGARICD